MALKNAIAGGTGTYTATATTGELRNAYNKLRGREVTKEDWIKPVWSTETAVSTLVGAGLGAYSRTKTDLKVRAKYERDVNTLVKELEVYANKFNEAIQNGDQQSALDIVRTSRDKLVQFSMNKYGNRTVNPKVMNEVANKWRTYLESTTAYYNFVYNDMNANVNGQGKLGNPTLENLKNKYNTNTVVPSSQTLREKYSMPTKLSLDTSTQNDYTKINLGETANIPTNKLMELYNSGGERTAEQISALREDIKNNGVKEPIEISQNSDGTYTIENGNHRLQIANELGIDKVPVKMVESWDSFVSRLKQNHIKEGAKSEYETNNTATNSINTSNEKSRSSVGLLRDSTEPFGSGRGTTTNVGISTSKSDSNQQTSSNENKGTNRKKNTIKNSNKSSFSLPKNSAKSISDNTQTLTNKVKSFQNIIKNNSTIQGLEDYSEQDIKNIVSDYVENLDSDVKIKNVKLNSSHENGLNATIEYDGNISQEELTDILNQEPLTIDGVKININAEDLNVFEENKRYDNVDIIEESDYNRYTTNQKANKISNKISNNEKAQVASEALQWRQDEADGIHYIDLSAKGYKSYVYNKTGNDIQTLLRIDGAEDFKNYIRKGVEDGDFASSEGLIKPIEAIRTEYGRYSNDNDVLSNGRNSKTNDRTHIKSIRQQRRNNNGEITTKSSRNELIENSEQSSFSLLKNFAQNINDNMHKNRSNTSNRGFKDPNVKTANGSITSSRSIPSTNRNANNQYIQNS